MKSDKKLKQSFKLYIGDCDIIYLEILNKEPEDDNNIRLAELIVEELTKFLDESPDCDYTMLIDLTKVVGLINLPNRLKEIFSKNLIFKRMSKIAVVTPNLLVKMLTSTLSLVGGKYEGVKSFDNKEKAIEWLKPT